MTIAELCKKYELDLRQIEEFASRSIIPTDENGQFDEKDIPILSDALSLKGIGLDLDEIKRFFDLKSKGLYESQIDLLRKNRRRLLDEVHAKEHSIYQTDNIIYEIEKNNK